MDKDDRQSVKNAYPKKYNRITKNTFVADLMPQLKSYLTEDENGAFIKSFDNSKWELHFLNGYIDMNTGEFLQRNIADKPVTYVLPREYKKSNKKQIKYILSILNKIMTDEDDLDILLKMLAMSLTGDSTKDQTSLFLQGDGSNGKSLVMEILKFAFCDYIQSLDRQTFVKGYAKQEKILNTFIINAYIRMAWVNEFAEGLIDGSLFKNFIDGKITTTSLFKDGQNTIKHLAMMIGTMNTIPSFLTEPAMIRRINAMRGKSKFVEDEDDVDEENHVYLKDKSILDKIERDDGMLNAVVDLIVQYSVKLSDGEKIEPEKNENMRTAKEELVSCNDSISDFIEANLIITNEPNDKIHKDDMYESYKQFKPNSLITHKQLMTSLAQAKTKVHYNGNLRANGHKSRGAYFGVKFAGEVDMFADQSNQDIVDYKVDKSNKSVDVNPFLKAERDELKKKCSKLEQRVAELEKKRTDTDTDSDSGSSSDDEPVVKKVPRTKPQNKKDDDNISVGSDFIASFKKLAK